MVPSAAGEHVRVVIEALLIVIGRYWCGFRDMVMQESSDGDPEKLGIFDDPKLFFRAYLAQ